MKAHLRFSYSGNHQFGVRLKLKTNTVVPPLRKLQRKEDLYARRIPHRD